MKNTISLLFLLLFFLISCSENKGIEDKNLEQETSNIERPTLEKGQANSLGKRMFLLCTACHSLKAGEASKVGPNLHGMFGKKAGFKEDFKYSEALLNSGIVWNDETMYKWIQNPTDYIPGTIMAFVGIEKEEQIKALIEYLKIETK